MTQQTNSGQSEQKTAPKLDHLKSGPQVFASFLATYDKVVGEDNPFTIDELNELGALTASASSDADRERLGALTLKAKFSGAAAMSVMGAFFKVAPDRMFSELRGKGLHAFQPVAGPVLIVGGDAVRDVFSRHGEFTVDPYGEEMEKVITSRRNPGTAGSRVYNFVLGTDVDDDFDGDREILNQVVNKDDPPQLLDLLTKRCQSQVGSAVRKARESGEFELDMVPLLARDIPMYLVGIYMGVPVLETRDEFELTDDMLRDYGDDIIVPGRSGPVELSGTGLKREDGTLPDADTMYLWIKTAYECFFNNVTRDNGVRTDGFRSSRLMLCLIRHRLVQVRERLQAGTEIGDLGSAESDDSIPDSMLVRLVKRQLDGVDDPERITDLRIAENMLGTTLGIMVGLEESVARVIDALLKLKQGDYEASSVPDLVGTFGDAREQALIVLDEGSDAYQRAAARKRLESYFREGLRLEPQAEVLMRACKKDNTQLFQEAQNPDDAALVEFAGNRPISVGTMVFVGHRSAMRDEAIGGPNEFRLNRPDLDKVFLVQGYGRHKCLGQYIAPVVGVEIMIALLALEGLDRAGPLKMDDKNLYAIEFKQKFSDGGTTARLYPPSA